MFAKLKERRANRLAEEREDKSKGSTTAGSGAIKVWKVVAPSFTLLDEKDKHAPVNDFVKTFLVYDDVRWFKVKERVPGYNMFTYVVYCDKKPFIESVRKTLELPVISDVFARMLLFKDVRVSTDLVELKGKKIYRIENPKDVTETTKVVMQAGADHLKSFLSNVNKEVFGAPETYANKDRFYGACINVYDMPPSIEIPALSDPTLDYDIMSIRVKTMKKPRKKGLKKVRSALQWAAKIAPDEYMEKFRAVDSFVNDLANNRSRMHRLSIVYTVFGETPEKVEEKVQNIKTRMDLLGVSVDQALYTQAELYVEGMPSTDFRESAIVRTTTLGDAYPFWSAEILDDDGVYIGTNIETGSPIIIDINDKAMLNKNVTVVGSPGTGKSAWSKSTIKKIVMLHNPMKPRPVTVGMDPSDMMEYKPVAEELGIPYISANDGIGDPIMEDEPGVISGILAGMWRMEKAEEDLLTRVIESIQTVNKGVDEDLKNHVIATEAEAESKRIRIKDIESYAKKLYPAETDRAFIDAIHTGMITFGDLFKGKPPTGSFFISTRMFNNDEATISVMALIMRRAVKWFHTLPMEQMKILLVDEGRLALKNKQVRFALENYSSMERKNNALLWFLTQRPFEISGTSVGAHVAENSWIKVYFGTDGIYEVREKYGLSMRECEEIATSRSKLVQGKAVLVKGHQHVLMQTYLTEEERKRYNTQQF